MHLRSHPGREDGFTLLELMVSIALVALITTYLFSSFSFGRRAWEVNAGVEETAGIEVARDYVRRRITQAYRKQGQSDDARETVVFDGRKDRLNFIAASAGELRTGGLYQVTLALEGSSVADREGGRLTLSEVLNQSESARAAKTKPHSVSLLDGVAELRFRYFGKPTFEAAEARWYDAWVDGVQLPNLVSVIVVFDERRAGRRSWPELVVDLKMANHEVATRQ